MHAIGAVSVAAAMSLALAAMPQPAHAAADGLSTAERLDFASGLEEMLGHFRALELNLDEGNAGLAAAHATHPVAELYDAMKPALASADPELDRRVAGILGGLKDRASTDVPRVRAQAAVDEAKEAVEAARRAVVGDELSSDTVFRMMLMKGLLETSIAEYGEAVEGGAIVEMAEFQDGSAFVWRAGEIFAGIRGDVDAGAAGEIDGLFSDLDAAYAARAPPGEVAAITGGIIHELWEVAYAGERLDFASGLEEMLGHFRALELNLDEGNAGLAAAHATHPVAELYDAMKPALASADPELDRRVAGILEGLKDRAGTDVPRARAQAAVDEAKEAVEAARRAVVGEPLSSDPVFRMMLMKGLLETSIAEYGEAVEGGAIVEMAEFQDGSAFVWRAGEIFEGMRGDVDAGVAGDIDGLFDSVDAAYAARAPPGEVDDATSAIMRELDEAAGMRAEEASLLEYVENINALLADARAAYGAGNEDLALSYATKAYLDNYEFLEAPLVRAGERELMEEVEVMMREELRGMMRDGAPVPEVEAQIDAVLDKMNAVAAVVPEFGTVAVIVLAAAAVAAVAAASARPGLRLSAPP